MKKKIFRIRKRWLLLRQRFLNWRWFLMKNEREWNHKLWRKRNRLHNKIDYITDLINMEGE